ncbi:DUF1090 domain-containing protein [Vibrio makurazakiensis]|uniref:DUF1090 domain-containing protein n=1 Tax=Vibrio makurazakiensis TaxID=2910250 RepID=UPI003D0D5294
MTLHTKKGSLLLLCALSFNSTASTQCEGLSGCEKKFCEIEYQITKAEEYGNKHKVEGLTKALNSAKENCTNEGLKDDLREKITSNEEDLSQYRSDLEKAVSSGETDKIRKYQRKIEKELLEIDDLKQKLSEIP